MNKDSEQIDAGLNIVDAQDQPLTKLGMVKIIQNILSPNIEYSQIGGQRVLKYKSANGKYIVLLLKAITYLGNPHPIFKKRIQIASWMKDFANEHSGDYDIRFIGVYHYNGLVVFVDFDTTRYISATANNSSAHVYINDLYQALCFGQFKKIDQKGNVITSISCRNFKNYLDGISTMVEDSREQIFDVFRNFNKSFCFDKTLLASDAIVAMRNAKWSKWKEAEWAGFYLEYCLDNYIRKNKITTIVQYIQNKKKDGGPDLDLYFPVANFYGDLKASDIKASETPANDKDTVLECISRNERIWYVVYEHSTIKDKDVAGTPMTIFWNTQLGKFNKLQSYSSRMKHSVVFKQMCIYEINRVNMNKVLRDFHQGKQQSGASRNPKFSIKKKDADNFVIFRG